MRILERLTLDSELHEELRYLHMARYEFACGFVEDRIVLDAACGTGYGTAMLAMHGAKEVTGVDRSEEAIAYAREDYHQPGIRFITGDVQNLPYKSDKDIVVSFETIEHLPAPEDFLHCVTTALKPEGVLLISTPLRLRGRLEDKPSNPFHYREWDETEFIQLSRISAESFAIF